MRGSDGPVVWDLDKAMMVRHGEEMRAEANLRHALKDVAPQTSRVTDDFAASHSEVSGKRVQCAFDRK